MRTSLIDYLNEVASRQTDTAFVHRPRLRRHEWTNGDISQLANQFTRELESRQIGHGDRVVVWAENSPEWVAAFFGIISRGAIAVPLDEQSAPDFVRRVCDKTEPKLLLYSSDVDRSSLNIPSIGLNGLPNEVAHHPAEPIANSSIRAADTIEIVFTSGTTAEPKGVVLTHGNLLANLEPMERQVKKYLKWKFVADPIRILCLLPLSHVFGQMMGIFLPRMLGAEVVFQDRLSPGEIIDTIRREHVMVAAAVPRVLETLRHRVESEYSESEEMARLNESLKIERSWLGAWWKYRRVHRMFGWRFLSFVTGGASLDESTESFWRRLGFAVAQGYGMTETAALVSLNNPFSSRRGSIGQVLAGSENIRINEGGEILVRGKNISPGYWGEKRRTDDEWLNTGDVGQLDETGRLYFRGRKKDVIVTAAGLNIYPEDLEAALSSQPETIASAVVAIDGANGPEPAAALILKPGTDAASLTSRANEGLAAYQQIRQWIIWPDADFPRTPTQKIKKNVVAATVAKLLAAPGKEAAGDESRLGSIIRRIGGRSKEQAIGPARLSEDLGLDSLGRVELLSEIEDKYQIDLDEQALSAATTVSDIENLVRGEARDTSERTKFRYPYWSTKFPISWFRPVFYSAVIYPITRLLCWVNTCGLENLRGIKGPVIFASNHVTYVDPPIIMSAMPFRFRTRLAIAMDGERQRAYRYPPPGTGLIRRVRWFFTYWLGIACFNAFPLPRQSGFRKSFSFAGDAMDRGCSVLIFPEGALTPDGTLQPLKSGVGILGNGLEAPIVPVAITGLYGLRAAGKRGWARPGKVTITFGMPMPFDSMAEPVAIAQKLEVKIKELETSEHLD
jgi:long-chain acyl-CoA synthetase